VKSGSDGFEVYDYTDRCWGLVYLRENSHGGYFGFLEPTEKYTEVSGLFELHDQLMSIEGPMDEEILNRSVQDICKLKVRLKNMKTNIVSSAGIVFVSKTKKGLLFICEYGQKT
jgi:hypothetical protein